MKNSNAKKLIPIIVLAVIIAILCGALAALTLAADDDAEDTGIPLCGIDAAAADKIAYTTDTIDISLTKSSDGVWTLDTNPALPLDQAAVEVIAEDIAAMAALRDLGTDADTSAMGFEEPQMVITMAAGESRYTLTVGATNDMTGSYYARTGDGESVYTIATSDLSSLCKADTALYAPQDITELESDDVTVMTLEYANSTLSFTQTDGTWALADDESYALDQDTVTRMASTICALQSTWSITEPQADSVYGLDAPNVTVTLLGTNGESVQCSFGATNPEDDGSCYLRSSLEPGVVYEVEAENLSAYAYTRETLAAATDETAAEDDTSDIIAEYPVGGADDYAS